MLIRLMCTDCCTSGYASETCVPCYPKCAKVESIYAMFEFHIGIGMGSGQTRMTCKRAAGAKFMLIQLICKDCFTNGYASGTFVPCYPKCAKVESMSAMFKFHMGIDIGAGQPRRAYMYAAGA